MHIEFLSLTKALNVPLLSQDDIAAVHRLQKQWEHWSNRERQHATARVAEEQHAAFTAFLDNPTAETVQRLLVTAVADLTGTRYATLRRACTALRGRIRHDGATLDDVLRLMIYGLGMALAYLHLDAGSAEGPA